MKSAFKYTGFLTVFFSLFFFSQLIANAATYYLSPTGSDTNNGTSITTAWKSLPRAWQSIVAGDTVFIKGGNYSLTQNQYLTGKNGTATNPINILAVAGETPIFTKTANFNVNQGYYRGCFYFSGDYFNWKGLEIICPQNPEGYVDSGFAADAANNNKF